MIRRLTGTIVDVAAQSVVIDVAGVGYVVFVPSGQHYTHNTSVTVHTHLAVRETALDLYGFTDVTDLTLFEHLLQLPKIGPKSALQIMSQATPELITTAIMNNDPSHLAKLSGLGKKTAEKVVSGLAEIYEKQGIILTPAAAAPQAAAQHVHDVIDALVALGYPEHDARKTAQQVAEEFPDKQTANDLVKVALQRIGT